MEINYGCKLKKPDVSQFSYIPHIFWGFSFLLNHGAGSRLSKCPFIYELIICIKKHKPQSWQAWIWINLRKIQNCIDVQWIHPLPLIGEKKPQNVKPSKHHIWNNLNVSELLITSRNSWQTCTGKLLLKSVLVVLTAVAC